MTLLFIALSIICSFVSIEEYWNVVNIFSALFLLALSYTKIKKRSIFYAVPVFILIIKDSLWWIINVGVNFPKLAVLMSISGILKMVLNIAIIIICIIYVTSANKEGASLNKKILLTQTICMMGRIVLFVIPLIIYHSTYHNLYIELLSIGSYAFLFAGYLYCLYLDKKE